MTSQICFEALLRLCSLRNGFEGSSPLLVHASTVLSFMALSNMASNVPNASREDIISTLILAIKGVCDQSKNYFICASILDILQQQMPSKEQAILVGLCTTKGEDAELKAARVTYVKAAQNPINTMKLTDDAESRWLRKLITVDSASSWC